MDDIKQVKYKELTFIEKASLNREYMKTFFRRSITFTIITLIAAAVLFGTAILIFVNVMFNKKTIMTAFIPMLMSIGIIFAMTGINLMWRKNGKSVLQQLGKKMIIVFVVSISVTIIGTILYLIYVFEIKNPVLYYFGYVILGIGAMIPCIAVLILRGKGFYIDDEFFQWLEKEKT